MTPAQLKKLDPNSYLKYSLDEVVEQESINARALLCSARFDFYGILIYIDHRMKGVRDLSFAKSVYYERTRAMTGFKLKEPGNESKNTFESYIQTLDKLIEDCANGEFDKDRTYIPVDHDNIPLDGAHRACCAAYFNYEVNILRFNNREYQFKGYQYLKHELLPIRISDWMALEASRWHDDIFVLFLWPQAHLHHREMLEAIHTIYDRTDVVYERDLKFSYRALCNLMLQIYGHMDWIGNIDNDFENIQSKADEVWDSNGHIKLVIARAVSCEYILSLKSEIRGMFGIGLSSIHTTDNIKETRLALQTLLNPNSIHFLEHARPTKYKDSYRLFEKYRQAIEENGLTKEDFIIDSSMALAMYGLREAGDLDFYCLPDTEVSPLLAIEGIEEHDDNQKTFYEFPIDDYIVNPCNYFVFNELKFMSLYNLLHFKEKRYSVNKDSKDLQDIGLIKSCIKKDNRYKQWLTNVKYSFLRRERLVYNYFYALIFWRRREILEKVGLYKPLKKVKNLFCR